MPVVIKKGGEKVVLDRKRTLREQSRAARRIMLNKKINDIFKLVDTGYSIPQAAREIGISPKNVSHFVSIINKRLIREQTEFAGTLRINIERKFNYVYRQFINEFEASTKNSKGERVPGNPEYLYGAQSLIQDIVKLHGLALEVQPNQTNVAFNWQSLQQLAQSPSQTVELQPESVVPDPIEDQIKQLESKAITDESSIDSAHITIQDTSDIMNGKKRVVLVNGKNGSSPKASNTFGKNGHTHNGMNGHGSGKQYHPEE